LTGYWPWRLGAITLASVAVGFRAATGRTLGVSGLYGRILRWREAGVASGNEDALRAALLKATRERFGEAAAVEAPEIDDSSPGPLSVSQSATFVAFLFVGGLISHLLGERSFRTSLGADFESIVGGGATAILALLGGGFLVGFGTRMAGGCTSGHGLNGCAQLQPASLVATAAFFGAGVVVSFLLGAL
jgi:hypothetical protein